MTGITLLGNWTAETALMLPWASVENTRLRGSKILRPEAEKSPARMRSVATLARPWSVFSSRNVSKLELKKSLSLLSFPPRANPNWLRVNGFLAPTCL